MLNRPKSPNVQASNKQKYLKDLLLSAVIKQMKSALQRNGAFSTCNVSEIHLLKYWTVKEMQETEQNLEFI